MKDTITLKLEPWIKVYLEDKAKRESKTTDELIEGILRDHAVEAWIEQHYPEKLGIRNCPRNGKTNPFYEDRAF